MAAIFIHKGGTSPSPGSSPLETETIGVPNQPLDGFEPSRGDSAAEMSRSSDRDRTFSGILGKELGDSDVRDAATTSVDHVSQKTIISKISEERKRIAERLCELMAAVLASHGRVKMAADIAVLKRELSRSHDVLGSSRAETNYLSIVTLVESNLASMDWKSATRAQLKNVRDVLAVGASHDSIGFDDYNKAVKRLRGQMLPTGPVFEIDVDENESDAE